MFYRFIRGLLRFLAFFLFRFRAEGLENVPEGAAVVCCNHTSMLDPIFVIMALDGRDPLRIMLKTELTKIPVFSAILKGLKTIPVNREMNDMRAVKTSMGVLKDGQKLFIFPEGTRVRPGMQIAPKTGAVMMAYRCRVPLLPVYVTEGNKPPFSRIRLVVGSPYMVDCGQKRPPAGFYEEQSKLMMDRIFALRPGTTS